MFRWGVLFTLLQHSLCTHPALRCFVTFAYTHKAFENKKILEHALKWQKNSGKVSGNICISKIKTFPQGVISKKNFNCIIDKAK